MQPHKSTPLDLFSKPARYLCPIFQRGYVWTLALRRSHCQVSAGQQ